MRHGEQCYLTVSLLVRMFRQWAVPIHWTFCVTEGSVTKFCGPFYSVGIAALPAWVVLLGIYLQGLVWSIPCLTHDSVLVCREKLYGYPESMRHNFIFHWCFRATTINWHLSLEEKPGAQGLGLQFLCDSQSVCTMKKPHRTENQETDPGVAPPRCASDLGWLQKPSGQQFRCLTGIVTTSHFKQLLTSTLSCFSL